MQYTSLFHHIIVMRNLFCIQLFHLMLENDFELATGRVPYNIVYGTHRVVLQHHNLRGKIDKNEYVPMDVNFSRIIAATLKGNLKGLRTCFGGCTTVAIRVVSDFDGDDVISNSNRSEF